MWRVLDGFLLVTVLVVPWVLLVLALRPFRAILRRDRTFLLLLGVLLWFLLATLLSPLTETFQQGVIHATAKPWLAAYRESVRFGRTPLWIAQLGTGLPALAHPWLAYLSPFTPLVLFFKDLDHAVNVLVFLHVVFAAVSMAVVARSLGWSRTAAALSAFALMWNPWVFRRMGPEVHALYLFGFAWFPLAWGLTLHALHAPSARAGARAGIPLGLMGVSMPTLAVHAATALAVLWVGRVVWSLRRRSVEHLRRLAAAGLALVLSSFLAVAPEILASAELLRTNEGTRLTTDRIYGWRSLDLQGWELLRLFLPNDLGASLTGKPPISAFGVPFSPGDAVVALALLGFLAALADPHWRQRLLPVEHGVLAVVFVNLVTHGPLYEPLLRHHALLAAAGTFPGASLVFLQVIVLFSGLGVVTVGRGLRRIGRWLLERVRAGGRIMASFTLLAGAGLVLLLLLEMLWGLRALSRTLVGQQPRAAFGLRFSIGRLRLADFDRLPHLKRLGELARERPEPTRIFCVGDVARWPSPCFEHAVHRYRLELVGVGELAWSLPRWQARPLGSLFGEWRGVLSPLWRHLLQLASVEYVVSTRKLDLPVVATVPWDPAPGDSELYGEFAGKTIGGGVWTESWDGQLRIHAFSGFPRTFFADGVILTGSEEEQDRVAQALLGSATFHPRKIVLLRAGRTGVYPRDLPVLSAASGAAPQRGEFFAAHASRTRPVENVKVRLRGRHPGAWDAEGEFPRPGVLFFSQLFYPGARASVNGAPAPVYLAHLFFSAVPVPAGKVTVRLEYAPWHLALAGVLPWVLIGGLLHLDRRLPRASSMLTP